QQGLTSSPRARCLLRIPSYNIFPSQASSSVDGRGAEQISDDGPANLGGGRAGTVPATQLHSPVRGRPERRGRHSPRRVLGAGRGIWADEAGKGSDGMDVPGGAQSNRGPVSQKETRGAAERTGQRRGDVTGTRGSDSVLRCRSGSRVCA